MDCGPCKSSAISIHAYKILYLYTVPIKNNILDGYTCLTQLKHTLEIEYNMCKNTDNGKKII